MEVNFLEFFLLLFLDKILKVLEHIVRIFNSNLMISTEKLYKFYSIIFHSG